MRFVNDLVDAKLLERQFFGLDHGLDDLDGVPVESRVVDKIVFRYLAEEVELLQ
ncbi:MAG: hypothetical protein ACMG6E_09690 [Candidatus Roizmanbacteria bacterium]